LTRFFHRILLAVLPLTWLFFCLAWIDLHFISDRVVQASQSLFDWFHHHAGTSSIRLIFPWFPTTPHNVIAEHESQLLLLGSLIAQELLSYIPIYFAFIPIDNQECSKSKSFAMTKNRQLKQKQRMYKCAVK
jgi:hypothetical protein